jgi:hypothetical protein
MKHFQSTLRMALLGAGLLALAACEKERAPLVIATTYDGANFVANTTAETSLLGSLDQLGAEMKKGRTAGTQVSYTTLSALYGTGNPSLQASTTTYFADLIQGPGGWLDELAKASTSAAWTPGTTQGEGGVYDVYLFDENGVDIEQVVHKGLYGAALYNTAYTIMQESQFTIEDVDRLVKLFGATPVFSNSDDLTKHGANADKYAALYAARRDKNDGAGVYTAIRDEFLKLQSALRSGAAYNAERDEALAELRVLWEKANAATVINYLHAATSLLSATSPTDKDKAAALHSLSEAVGFLHGWRSLPAGARRITDAQIDEYLALLNAPQTGEASLYQFATEAVTELPQLVTLIDKLQTLYGFSDSDVEDFKKNWVKEQNR